MMTAVTALTILVTIFFAGMGLLALVRPEQISGTFGTPSLTADGRNEVRAVYGGFGVAIAVLLATAPLMPALGRGIYVAVAIALVGMAGGRLVAAMVERPRRFYPCWCYCALEAAMAAILLAASVTFF